MIEGRTTLDVVPSTEAGPGKRSAEPFYNPIMALNRDISVSLLNAYVAGRGRGVDVADVLTGAGARAVRIANEVHGDVHVYANDAHPAAIAAAKANAKANGVADRVTAEVEDAHRFLAARRYDVVDIDPYGSPMPFLDAGMRATRHQGLLCLTATDTAALSGRFPRVCRRRYGAEHGLHTMPWRQEVGLRILAGAAVRAAGRFDRIATPVLSVAKGHWMRVVVRVEDGRQKADQASRRLDFVHAKDGLATWGHGTQEAGPLWTGPLHEAATVDAMEPHDSTALAKLLPILRAEARAPPFWVHLPDLQGLWGSGTKKSALVAGLEAAGVATAPTHMDPQGVRCDTSAKVLKEAWSYIAP